jgi:hypothetical protein
VGERGLLPEIRPLDGAAQRYPWRQRLIAADELPAVLLADVVGGVDDAPEHDEGAFRRMNGAANQVGMSIQAHAFLSGGLSRERVARRGWQKSGRDGSMRERHHAAEGAIPVQWKRLGAVAAAVTHEQQARFLLRGDVVMRASEFVGSADDHGPHARQQRYHQESRSDAAFRRRDGRRRSQIRWRISILSISVTLKD